MPSQRSDSSAHRQNTSITSTNFRTASAERWRPCSPFTGFRSHEAKSARSGLSSNETPSRPPRLPLAQEALEHVEIGRVTPHCRRREAFADLVNVGCGYFLDEINFSARTRRLPVAPEAAGGSMSSLSAFAALRLGHVRQRCCPAAVRQPTRNFPPRA